VLRPHGRQCRGEQGQDDERAEEFARDQRTEAPSVFHDFSPLWYQKQLRHLAHHMWARRVVLLKEQL
jgi:hypothetical protein